MEFTINRDSECLSSCAKRHEKRGGRHDWKAISNEMNSKFSPKPPKGWRSVYNSEIRKGKDGLTSNARRSSKVEKRKLSDEEKESVIKKALLSSPKTARELSALSGCSELEALGIVERLRMTGLYSINSIDSGKGRGLFIDRRIMDGKATFDYSMLGSKKEISFMAVSDSHIGCKEEQITFLKELYRLAKERGIKTVFHSGDITDGFYKSRPEQAYELVPGCAGFDGQAERVIKNYPKEDGITTYFITGNHDDTHIKNGGANIGRKIADCRNDMVYLGQNNAYFKIGGIMIELFHPGGGSAYSLSYKPQKRIEFINALPDHGERPDIVLQGHFHKSLYLIQSGINFFLVPSTCGMTAFEDRNTLWNVTGAWIVTVKTSDSGKIASITPEYVKEPNYLKDDWENYE